MCPLLLKEQQSQLQMNIFVDNEASEEGNEDAKEKDGFMGIQVAVLQWKELTRNRAYLDNCSTVTAFKTAKYIHNIMTKKKGIQVNCNAGSIKTNQKREYGRVEAWYTVLNKKILSK